MTDCVQTTFTRVGSHSVSLSRVGGNAECLATRVGTHSVTMTASGVPKVSMRIVCTARASMFYLEIQPKIVWVLEGWTQNDVISNTDWRIN